MFLRNDFIKQAEYAFRDVKAATAKKSILVCVGMPVEEHGKLYNCAVYVQGGSIIGVVPKTYIPNYGEFYEKDGLYHPPAVKQIPSVFVEALSRFPRNFSSVGMTALLSEQKFVKICGLIVHQADC